MGGFQTRDESMDFKMATGEFERMKQNLKEAKKLNDRMKINSEDFSLGDDEVLVMKPKKKKKKKNENGNGDGDGGDALGGFLPPPSDSTKDDKKKKKKKIKKTDDTKDDKLFGDFNDAKGGNSGGADDGWATFD